VCTTLAATGQAVAKGINAARIERRPHHAFSVADSVRMVNECPRIYCNSGVSRVFRFTTIRLRRDTRGCD
jgi:hypothetical protein